MPPYELFPFWERIDFLFPFWERIDFLFPFWERIDFLFPFWERIDFSWAKKKDPLNLATISLNNV